MGFVTYRVGRAADADVRIDAPDVSRRQVEITLTVDGRYYVTDCGSASGTFIHDGGSWIPLKQGFVTPESTLSFGEARFRFSELIARLPSLPRTQGALVANPPSVRPRRKLGTGEVEFARGKERA
jgi:predicted component of type VI protein secretion system